MSVTLLDALNLSLRVAAVATLIVIVPGTALGWWLARREFVGKSVLSTLVVLPLVLPPTAVGYLLLGVFADRGPLGRDRLGFDLDLLFTWKGAVLAAAVMAAPLVIRTARVTFEGIDPRYEAMARTLGHGPFAAVARFTLPAAARGLGAAAILGFTRSLGEFGATVMIAGNIPGRTQTLSSAIWTAEQAGRDAEARVLLGVALVVGFIAVWLTERLTHARRRR